MSFAPAFGVGKPNSLMANPATAMRPIRLAARSVNQMAPSAPVVIPVGRLPGVGRVNSLNRPAWSSRPMRPFSGSVNQTAWSGPPVISPGVAPDGMEKIAMTPPALMRPMALMLASVK
jgi:hypothetical protein